MAPRLTDIQKSKIIADYLELGSYRAVAKLNGVADNTVRKVIENDRDFAQKVEIKKRENQKAILEHMETKKETVCDIIDLGLEALKKPEKMKKANPSQITTAIGTLIDKFTAGEQAKTILSDMPFEIPARLLAAPFVDVHRDILEKGHIEYVEEGGRGSTKSSFISLEIPALIKNNPQLHAVCCRKIGNTLRDSVFSQIVWAIDALGLAEEFESRVSPLEITYKPTGQKIYFQRTPVFFLHHLRRVRNPPVWHHRVPERQEHFVPVRFSGFHYFSVCPGYRQTEHLPPEIRIRGNHQKSPRNPFAPELHRYHSRDEFHRKRDFQKEQTKNPLEVL